VHCHLDTRGSLHGPRHWFDVTRGGFGLDWTYARTLSTRVRNADQPGRHSKSFAWLNDAVECCGEVVATPDQKRAATAVRIVAATKMASERCLNMNSTPSQVATDCYKECTAVNAKNLPHGYYVAGESISSRDRLISISNCVR
jgi:hypothetical protein